MSEPDTAAAQADFMAQVASLPKGQQVLQSGFAHSAVQRGGNPVNHNGHFPKGFSGDLQV